MIRHQGTFVSGVVFIVVGVVYLLSVLGSWSFDTWRLWPVVLIAVGATVLLGGTRRHGDSTPPDEQHPEEPAD
jgi:uncharacterized membrane protein YhhN